MNSLHLVSFQDFVVSEWGVGCASEAAPQRFLEISLVREPLKRYLPHTDWLQILAFAITLFNNFRRMVKPEAKALRPHDVMLKPLIFTGDSTLNHHKRECDILFLT
jgi:hypothetical protein